MRSKNFGFRVLAVFVAASFLWSSLSWSMSDEDRGIFSLRARSAVERNHPIDYDPKNPPANRTLGQMMDELKEVRDRLAPGIPLVLNEGVFRNQLEAAKTTAGGRENDVMVVVSLCAGRGTRFERAQMADLESAHNLTPRIRQKLVEQGVSAPAVILMDRKSRLNSAEYEKAAFAVLEEDDLENQVLTKMEYPVPGPGFDNNPIGSFGLRTASELGLPIIVVAGYKASDVIPKIGAANLAQVLQPGFEHTREIVVPGRYPLGTGLAAAQCRWAIPEEFTGSVFITMGDTPFVDDGIMLQAKSRYEQARGSLPQARGIVLTGTIVGDPFEPGYGRIVSREENGARILDRIIEVKDICALISNSLGRSVKQSELHEAQSQRQPKEDLIRRARGDSGVKRAIEDAAGNFEADGTISIPDEQHLDAAKRRKLDDALARIGLLRKKVTGELLDGWELIATRDYNSGLYVFDHQAFRSAIDNTKNDNAPREYYLTDVPAVLEDQGYATVCVSVSPEQSWRLEGINTPDELKIVLARLNTIGELQQRLGVSEAEAMAIIEESRAAVKRTFVRVGKPLTMEPYADGLGGTYMGAAQIVTYMLKASGRKLPPGQDYFLLPAQTAPLVEEAVASHPYLGREEVSLDVDDGKGGSEKGPCVRYYNKLYRKILNERSEEITDEEIDYLLQNLQENSVERYLVMYLKGVPVRAQADAARMSEKIAARPGDKRTAIWDQNRASAEQEQRVFTAIWQRIEARAAALVSSRAIAEGSPALEAWKNVSAAPIDPVTGLPTGNPDRKPFAVGVDVEATHASVVRMFVKNPRIVSTESGIRGQYGDPFGDIPLPPDMALMGGVFDCGTQPIPAALVGAASQIELLLQVLEDTDGFLTRIPAEKMKGDTLEKRQAELDKTRTKFKRLLEKTQRGKSRIDRANGKPPRVVVFRETRSTGEALADADIRAAIAMGAEVEYAEVADVTAAANYVRDNPDIHVGIYISASHNPEADNGLKILLGDGRVAPSDLAYPFIYVYHNLLCHDGHTGNIIARVNGVDTARVSQVYARARDVRRRVREMEEEYLVKMMTDQTDLAQARRVRDEMAKVVMDAGLAIVQERNGSSRNDEWLEDFGFAVITENARYRYDMNRPLCPYPAAVAQAGPQVAAAIEVLNSLGFKVCLSQHPDVDGDRSLFPVMGPDGKLFVRPDHVERTFITTCVNLPLDEQYWDYNEHASRKDEANPENSKILAYSINDPSSIGMEIAADVMGFIVLRRQVGEANVADGMEYLANLTWAEAKKVASERQEWLYVPKKLLERFADPKYDNVKLTCLGGGEASNGSFFDLSAMVRDPAKHLSSFMKLFHPVSGPKRVRELLHLFGKEEQFDPHWWDKDQLPYLPYRMIQILPATRDACYFTPKSLAQIENPLIGLLGLVSENMDDVLFDEGVLDRMCRGLEEIWAQRGVKGTVKPIALNVDDRSYIGRGNCLTDVPIGQQLRGGGYEIIFEIEINGVAYPFSWGWKRGSKTESRLTRVGPSAGFPVLAVMDGNIGSISAADENTQQALVDECFNYIRLHFTAALWKAMALATKEMLACDPAAEAPKPQRLQRYIDAVNDGPGEFARKMHPELAAWVKDDIAKLEMKIPEAIEHNKLVEREVIEHARAAYFINRLPLDQYRDFLMSQRQLAAETHAAVLEIIDLYLGELSGLDQLTAGAHAMPELTSI